MRVAGECGSSERGIDFERQAAELFSAACVRKPRGIYPLQRNKKVID